jgi:serine/threonine protein kinase
LGSASSIAKLVLEEVGEDSGESSSENEDENRTDIPPKSVTITRSRAEDSYTMQDELGRGKFGIVKKCVDKATGREYAAKFIACNGKAARDEVLHEIDVMNELNHKRLLRLEAAYDLGKEMVLVMELITGGELFEKLVQEDFISEQIATSYLEQLLDGLGYMHRKNILHLDLKPENMMLVRPGSKRIKIIDYGLARKYNPNQKLQVMQGTPEFAAPEVIAYEGVTPATDVWAVGVITYVVLSGLSPFLGDDDGETMSNISSMAWEFDDPVFDEVTDEAKDFISRILIKDERKRMTILECQAHAWLRTKSNKKIETQRLKTFTARRKWKKALTAVRSTNFLSRILNKSGKGAGDKTNSGGKGAFLAKIKQQIAAEESTENSENAKDVNENVTAKIEKEAPLVNGDIKQEGNTGTHSVKYGYFCRTRTNLHWG